MAVGTRLPVQAESSATAWEARHRDAEIQDVHLRERVLLAWTSHAIHNA